MTLDEAWMDAVRAIGERGGGSPYLSVTCDLVGWCEATGSVGSVSFTEQGDTAEEALERLAAKLRDAE